MGDTRTGVRSAAKALATEHRELLLRASQLAETRDLRALIPQLEAMQRELSEHFAREQYPEGLYDQIGLTAESQSDRDLLRELIDEHFHMLTALHGIIAVAKYAGTARSAEVFEKTAGLVAELRAHELKERALILAALHPEEAQAPIAGR